MSGECTTANSDSPTSSERADWATRPGAFLGGAWLKGRTVTALCGGLTGEGVALRGRCRQALEAGQLRGVGGALRADAAKVAAEAEPVLQAAHQTRLVDAY